MDPHLQNNYHQFQLLNSSCPNITAEYLSHLWDLVYQSYKQNQYSQPMVLIGVYIALASLICIIAMVADLLHGLRNRKLWFPCKYFTLNAASITVMAVAIKLPMDLTTLMPGYVDQAAKLGSVCFFCTMMVNLLPSLTSMDSMALILNVTPLVFIVVNLHIDVFIQTRTGVLTYHVDKNSSFQAFNQTKILLYPYERKPATETYYYYMFLMALIYASSVLGIPKSKRILESKCQAAHEAALKDEELKQPDKLLNFEKLKQHVSNYWIMAGTGNPQIMTTCSLDAFVSSVICAVVAIMNIRTMPSIIQCIWDYQSDYKWSTSVIFIIQFVGVIVGTIAPLFRCIAALIFTLSSSWIWNQLTTFPSIWTGILSYVKQSRIQSPSSNRKCKIVIKNLIILVLGISALYFMVVSVALKIALGMPILSLFLSLRCWKWLEARFSSSHFVLVQNSEQRDLVRYLLKLKDNIELTESALEGMIKPVNHLIQKAEKLQPNNLIKLLEKSYGFGGVEKFDSHHVPPLLPDVEHLNCWSFPLVTLTTIAISLRNIQNNKLVRLSSGVNEGLVYVTLVEKTLNSIPGHTSIQMAAKTLWEEVYLYDKWLGNNLQNPYSQLMTAVQILQRLRDIAKNIVMEVEGTGIGDANDESRHRYDSANSMYRITETFLFSFHGDIEKLSQEELFEQLLRMIAEILAACLKNLPQVIIMKCHTSAIDKREASVKSAAQLLGETRQIINIIQQHKPGSRRVGIYRQVACLL